MKELVIISGKGGTGKTCLSSSLAVLADNPVICDCDVEAPNLHILLQPQPRESGAFSASRRAWLDPEKCVKCELCMEICRFDAVSDYQVSDLDCEGCGFCSRICPVEAIRMEDRVSGEWYRSETVYGPMFHARLRAGQPNSGKLVALLRRKAKEAAKTDGRRYIITDGPPGTGCPTIAAITGCSLAAIVTEPTLSAIHDMQRVIELCEHFKVRFGVVINKCDLSPIKTQEIKDFCRDKGIAVWGSVPYREDFLHAIDCCLPPVSYSKDIAEIVKPIWKEMEVCLSE